MKLAVKIVEVPGLPNLRCFAASLLKTEAPDGVLDNCASSGSIDLEPVSPEIRGTLPEVSWLFFKAVRAGLAEKRPYLCHTGRASNAEKQPTGPGPEGCDENGPAAGVR